VARAGRFATIGGKAGGGAKVRLGRWRWPALGAVFFYLMATSVIPVVGLLIVSLQPFWTPNIDVSKFTLANYDFVLFESSLSSSALVNSLLLGAIGGTLGMLLAAFLALCGSNVGGTLAKAIDAITALPAAFPHTVLGVGFLVTFSQGWLNIHGTLLLLLLVYLVMFLPQAARSASSSLAQVGRELVEASHVFRASSLRTFRRIVIPLMLPGLVAGWVILFVQMAGELTASALLSGPSNPVVGLVLLDLWENGSFPQLTAMALIMTVLDTAVVLLVLRYFRGALRS
ncbi:MAG: ABC transporter permease subunit, partial [Tistlia sp.]